MWPPTRWGRGEVGQWSCAWLCLPVSHSCLPSQGLEVPLIAVVQWSTPKLPFTTQIHTHYR